MQLAEHEAREANIPAHVREQVLERDSCQCQACGTGGENRLQLHHILYRSQGGRHVEENLVTLCRDCHSDVHAGWLVVQYIEWYPGLWSFFCARKRPPARWRQHA